LFRWTVKREYGAVIDSATMELTRNPLNNSDQNETLFKITFPEICLNLVKRLAAQVRVHEKGTFSLIDLIKSVKDKEVFKELELSLIYRCSPWRNTEW